MEREMENETIPIPHQRHLGIRTQCQGKKQIQGKTLPQSKG